MRIKLRTALVISMIWAMTSSISQAESPNYNLSVAGMYSKQDNDDDTSLTLMGIGAKYYFMPVNPNKGPLNEADFLDRQSNVLAIIGTLDVDFGTSIDGNFYNVGAEYADQSQPFTVNVNYIAGSAKKTITGTSVKVTLDTTSVSLGYYMDAHTALYLEYDNTTSDIKVDGSSIGKYDADSFGVRYKNVMLLESSHYANFEAGFSNISDNDNNSNNELFVRGDYYDNIQTGLFAGLAYNSGDDSSSEGTTISAGINIFLTPSANFEFEFDKFSAKANNNDSQSISFGFEARF